jgi:hypothetical protein
MGNENSRRFLRITGCSKVLISVDDELLVVVVVAVLGPAPLAPASVLVVVGVKSAVNSAAWTKAAVASAKRRRSHRKAALLKATEATASEGAA